MFPLDLPESLREYLCLGVHSGLGVVGRVARVPEIRLIHAESHGFSLVHYHPVRLRR